MTATEVQIKPVTVGNAMSRPGEIVYGWFDIAELPTGHTERLPVVIVQGREPGPCFWFTANIHGDELTGMAALHATITADLARDLRGTVVAIPSLNPAGLRIGKREPYLEPGDPNRTFPGYRRPTEEPSKAEREAKNPTIYEEAMARLFDVIKDTADFLIDLHCYDLQATSFTIRDRVLYRNDAERGATEELYRRTDEMCKAFGLPVVNESTAARYVDAKLHRSTSGAALNEARIPSFTVELGLIGGVDPNALTAAKTGIFNSLKWAGLLPGEIEPITTVPLPYLPFNTMRENTPRAHRSGILRYHVRPGDVVREGQVVATLTDIHGRVLPDGDIRAEHDGWVISLTRGAMCYQGQSVTNMAIRDDEPMVEPFPV